METSTEQAYIFLFIAVVLLQVFNNFMMCYFDSLFQNEIGLSPILVFVITVWVKPELVEDLTFLFPFWTLAKECFVCAV